MATSPGHGFRSGCVAGAIAAVAMVVAQAIARIGAGVPMFPDLLEDLTTRLIPPPLFSRVLDTLHFEAKPLLFVGLLLAQIVAGALIGGLAARWLAPIPQASGGNVSPWRRGLVLAAGLWLVTGLLALPVAGQGAFGSANSVGVVGLNLVLVVSFLLFGLTAVATRRIVDDASAVGALGTGQASNRDAVSQERRRLLGGVAVGAVAVVAVSAAYRVLALEPAAAPEPAVGPSPTLAPRPTAAPSTVPTTPNAPLTTAAATVTPTTLATSASAAPAAPVATPTPPSPASGWTIKGLAAEVTSTDDFYKVSKNFFSDPNPDSAQWTLQVTGLVSKPYTLHYQDLLKLPAIERYQTLQCISNLIGGDLIGNALWRGASLADVIRAAEPKANAVKVVFTAADGYQDSITFERAMSQNNLIAHTMNGQPLLTGHGMPARLLIPGIYGMKNVKWLTKIEVMAIDFKGYWQERGWSDDAFINTMSRIDVPRSDQGKPKAGAVTVAGIAFGGDKGISKVEVSADGGTSWQAATLKEPLGQFTWRLWRFNWQTSPGEHELIVRATNGTGELQTSKVTDTLPNGATGWHSITVDVTS
jgi:DMSO/TMAO reductase YedYZ molybdopterin-dependent catalytic subunit